MGGRGRGAVILAKNREAELKNRSAVAVLLWLAGAVAWAQYAPAVARWNRPVEPFCIVGNVYYVGASSVSSFLITTPEGHILIDTGFTETVPQIAANVKKLGFRMEDVRLLLANHAHYDHAGGMAAVKALTKARLIVNPEEVAPFARGGKGDFAFGDTYAFPPVTADGVFRDGEEIRLGGVALVAHFTPGHTRGTTTYTTTVREGEHSYRVVFAASVTTPGYQLADNPAYPNIAGDLEKTFATLRALPCDVFLAGHSWEFGMDAKLAARGGDRNPFVDPEGYRRWVDRSEARFRKQLTARRIAITIDDLPCAGPCRSIEEAASVTARIVEALKQERVPAVGFVIGKRVDGIPAETARRIGLLKQWLDAGMTLGNHTYSHPDANQGTLEEFEQDVLKGEAVLRQVQDQQPRYFRFPFTHTGGSVEKKAAIEEFLRTHGYEPAPFTIEHEDWLYNVAWLRARRRGDPESVKRIQTAYLDQLDAKVAFAEGASHKLFGREIPQILLTHANALNAECLPAMLERLKARGYEFVSLEEALRDSAYRTPDKYTGPSGPSWLHRWSIALGIPTPMKGEPESPEWVQKAAQDETP
jgi:glyoxylase-like metal-dependent hydrolase (beta-lactamase superfamily II)/peptidoglycan/xylan/chitin deacetylase (PgdA/CDA1 family)